MSAFIDHEYRKLVALTYSFDIIVKVKNSEPSGELNVIVSKNCCIVMTVYVFLTHLFSLHNFDCILKLVRNIFKDDCKRHFIQARSNSKALRIVLLLL